MRSEQNVRDEDEAVMASVSFPANDFSGRTLASAIHRYTDRFHLINLLEGNAVGLAMDGSDVVQGLGCAPKTLPAKYFYDDHGSSLFERICTLPEYYLTRTERALLTDCAAELAHRVGPCDLIELGSGSSTKTQLLFQAYGERHLPLHYVPIDVSGGMLKQSALSLLEQYPNLDIQGVVGTYDQALTHLPQAQAQRLIVFLGSSLGNLNPTECDQLFNQICSALQPGGFFLLGIDLQKHRDILEAAYNDSQGVTAAFNLNMLRHLNWRFDGNFCLNQFSHQAVYNEIDHQIEMYLRSHCDQSVTLDILDFSCTFAAKETIRTEISRKFSLPELQQNLQRARNPMYPDHALTPIQIWSDPQQYFALVLSQLQQFQPIPT
jgi:dimethylhistidine N-methyltransferase